MWENVSLFILMKLGYPASYKTPAVLLIYIVKTDKSLVGDWGKKSILCKKEKTHCIRDNGQPDYYEDCRIFVAMTST